MTTTPPPRRRLPRTDLRRRVLEQAGGLLASGGLTVGLEHLNMEDLIRRAGVPRSSAFAAFGGKEELVTELMVHSLNPTETRAGVGYSPSTVTAAREVLTANAHRMVRADGTPDPDGQEAVMREIIRVVLRLNMDETTESTEWRTFMALSVSARTLPEARRERVLGALHDAETRFIDTMAGTYGELLTALGRRPAPGLTFRHLASAGAAVVEGIVSQRLVGSADAEVVVQRPGLDGEPVEWHLVSLAFLAMILELTERAD